MIINLYVQKNGKKILAKCDTDFTKENSLYWGLNRHLCKSEININCQNSGSNSKEIKKSILNVKGNKKYDILINNLGKIIPKIREKICQNSCLKCDDRDSDNIIYWRQIAYITVINANIWNNMTYDGGNWVMQTNSDDRWYINVINGEFQKDKFIEGFVEGMRDSPNDEDK